MFRALLVLVTALRVVPAAHADPILYATAATTGEVTSYCIRAGGVLDADPMQRINTIGNSPSRLILLQTQPDPAAPPLQFVYAAENDRVEVFQVGPGGPSHPPGADSQATRSERPGERPHRDERARHQGRAGGGWQRAAPLYAGARRQPHRGVHARPDDGTLHRAPPGLPVRGRLPGRHRLRSHRLGRMPEHGEVARDVLLRVRVRCVRARAAWRGPRPPTGRTCWSPTGCCSRRAPRRLARRSSTT